MDWDTILHDAEMEFMKVVWLIYLRDYVRHHPEARDDGRRTDDD
jgi:hypothetical protein